jgi:hypothetical protein
MLFEPERRPSFEDIVAYIDKVESKPNKLANGNPLVSNLKDFIN